MTAAANDESILISATDSRRSGVTGAAVVHSAPMKIGDAFDTSLREAEPGSAQAARRIAAIFVLDAAVDVLRTGIADPRVVAAARRALKKLDHVALLGALEAILNIVDGTEYVGRDWRSVLVERMLEYATLLRRVGHMPLAAEVFTFAARARDVRPDITLRALQGRGLMLRRLGEYSRSERAYGEMQTIADEIGDVEMALLAKLGLARVQLERGNTSEGERAVRDVIERSAAGRLPGVYGAAHVDLSFIAGTRGQYDAAIFHAKTALAHPIPDLDRDLAGINLAMGYRMYRQFHEATAFALTVAEEALGVEERVGAWLVLYELAMDQGIDTDGVRDRLEGQRMSPQKRAELYEADARNAWFEGDKLACRRELASGLALADSPARRLAEMVVRLDGAMRELATDAEPTIFRAPNCPTPPDSALALRRIGDEARKARTESDARDRLRAYATATGDPPAFLVQAFVDRIVAAGA